MLVHEHLALFFAALAAAKLGLVDRKAPLTTLPASMVFFAGFALSAWNIQVGTGAGVEVVQSPGMAVLGFGGTLWMLAMVLLEALGKLPKQDVEAALANANQQNDQKKHERY